MKLFGPMSANSAVIVILAAIVICARLLSFANLSSLASANPDAYPYPIVAGDSSYYARWAGNLLALHAYEDSPGKPLHAAPPGYPALLAGMKAVSGSMTPIVIIQTILAAFATVLIYRIARTLVPSGYALIPAIAYAIDPMVVFTDSAIMTDGLFSSFLVFTVYLAFFQSHIRAPALSTSSLAARPRLKGIVRWGLVGLMLGVITMIRPIAQFLVLVFPAMYLLRERLALKQTDSTVESENSSRLKAVLACVLGFAVVVTPWILRNERVFGAFEISPLGGHNLLTYDVRGFLAWRALQDIPEPIPAILILRHADNPVFVAVDKQTAEDLAAITPEGKNPDNYEGSLAVSYILRDPFRYAYFHAVNTIPFFLSSSIATYAQITRQLRDNEGFYAPTMLSILGSLERIAHPKNARSLMSAVWSIAPIAFEMLWWMLVVTLALAALVLFRRNFTTLLCVILVVYFAALTGPMSASRYRIPAEPYLLILAAVGAREAVRRTKDTLKERSRARAAVTIAG